MSFLYDLGAAIQAILERGASVVAALSQVVGDVCRARLRFREAVAPYLEFAISSHKEVTKRRLR